jgi:hypothetical protein
MLGGAVPLGEKRKRHAIGVDRSAATHAVCLGYGFTGVDIASTADGWIWSPWRRVCRLTAELPVIHVHLDIASSIWFGFCRLILVY